MTNRDLDIRKTHLLCHPITTKTQKEKENKIKATMIRMYITKMLEMHQIMPLDIGPTMVGMSRTNRAKGITILIHHGLVTYTIRNQTVGAMKLKIEILCNLFLNIMKN
jgi:nucleoside phosphorylase